MFQFICPLCKNPLYIEGRTYKCAKNHCFDVARQGYVNLLLSQKSAVKRHGDDKLMVLARQRFLDKGYYDPLLLEVAQAVSRYTEDRAAVLDIGCGECFYTAGVVRLLQAKKQLHMGGIDISKHALTAGAKRDKTVSLAVASVSAVPAADQSCDAVLNVCAPYNEAEFTRILKKGAVLIRAIPLARHLWELKKEIYDRPYENKAENLTLRGFRLLKNQTVEKIIELDQQEDIQNLFKMTPYYYKTGIKDQKKLEAVTALRTQTAFSVLVYQKI